MDKIELKQGQASPTRPRDDRPGPRKPAPNSERQPMPRRSEPKDPDRVAGAHSVPLEARRPRQNQVPRKPDQLRSKQTQARPRPQATSPAGSRKRDQAPLVGKQAPRPKQEKQTQRASLPWTKYLSWLILLGLFLGVLSLAFSLFLKHQYEVDLVTLDNAAYKERDAVLVLGCGVYADGSPTPMLRDRMNAGIAAYFKGAGSKLLLSGDHGQKNYDEVQAMHTLALEAGVPEEDIFLDPAGFSTYDSLKRAKDIFGLESVCLVSQRYHLYRACYLADSLGLDYCGYPADAYAYKGQIFRDIREVLARVKDIFNATFQPQAEVMGPSLDIKGDGRSSWD